MRALRRWRFIYLLTRELSRKYTRHLLGGFLAGLLVSVALGQLYPFIMQQWFTPVDRIGVVGDFTPTTLPLSIQEKLSFGLTSVAEDGSAGPGLAESWEATDSGKTIIFHLRDNLYWHNGKQVRAHDVNYNIRSVSFEALDDRTLRANLEDTYAPFPTLVSKPILQEGLRGFGEYKVSTIKLRGDSVRYMRLSPVDEEGGKTLEYRFYQTEALALLAYKLGDIDIIDEISSPEPLRNWGNTTVKPVVKKNRVVAVFFNLKDQLMAEKSVRQALGYGLPAFAEAPAYSPINTRSWAYFEDIKKYESNPQQAEKLLNTAQINPADVTLTITTFPQYVDIAQDIANSWQDIGFIVNVRVENTLSDSYQILVSAQELPPDPDQYPFWHSQAATNITGYVNLKIDKLLEDGRRELDQEKRTAIYHDFQRFLVEDAPAIFLFYPKGYSASRQQPT